MDFQFELTGPTPAQVTRHARRIENLSDEVAASLYEQLVILLPGDPVVDQASVLHMIKYSNCGRTKVNKFLTEARHSLCPLADFGPAYVRPDLGPEPMRSSEVHVRKMEQAKKDDEHRRFRERTRAAAHGLHVSEYDFDADAPWQTYVDHQGVVQMTRWALSWYDKYQDVLAGESAFIKRMYLRGFGMPRMQIVGTAGVMDKLRKPTGEGWEPAPLLDVEKDSDDPKFSSPAEYLEWHRSGGNPHYLGTEEESLAEFYGRTFIAQNLTE